MSISNSLDIKNDFVLSSKPPETNLGQKVKVCMVTLCIGQRYIDMFNALFRPSQEAYARKHGYDYKVLTEWLDSNDGSNTFCHKKILHTECLLCEHFNEYDLVVYMDADIVINVLKAPPIHEIGILNDRRIGVVTESCPTRDARISVAKHNNWEHTAEEYYKIGGFDLQVGDIINTGVIMLQPKYHTAFMKNLYHKSTNCPLPKSHESHFEQLVTGYELHTCDVGRFVSHKWNALWDIACTYHAHILKKPITIDEFFDDNYFIHLAGHKDYDQVPRLNLRMAKEGGFSGAPPSTAPPSTASPSTASPSEVLSNKIVLLYLDSGYERDYIVEVLLRPHFEIVHELFANYPSVQTSDFESIREISKSKNAKVVFVFSSNTLGDVNVLERIFDIVEPTVVVHNSDEYGERESILRMSYKTKLFFTQYAYYYNGSTFRNTHPFNVPFMPGVIDPLSITYNTHQPKLIVWSFIGRFQWVLRDGSVRERITDLKRFKDAMQTDAVYCSDKTPKEKVCQIYETSVFTISPKGNVSMHCSRIFESIMSGCIPVMANDDLTDIERQFDFFGLSIPFVYANTWEECAIKCKWLLANPDDLEMTRKRCFDWYLQINARCVELMAKEINST